MKFSWGKGATVRLSVTKMKKFHIVPVLGISQINSKDRKKKKKTNPEKEDIRVLERHTRWVPNSLRHLNS